MIELLRGSFGDDQPSVGMAIDEWIKHLIECSAPKSLPEQKQ